MNEICGEKIRLYAKQLHLPSIARYADIIRQLPPDAGYDEFLERLLRKALDERYVTGQKRRQKAAGFPYVKTLDEFDMSRLAHVSPAAVAELSSCDFVKNRENVVMVGNPGSGKTHLAIALGMKACQAGFHVKFCTAMNLVTELSEALQERRLSKVEKNLKKADLLIIDELSYLTFNRTQSELLFQVITERSERASVIITTNLEVSGWIQLFENEMMLAALVDRVTFHAHILNINTAYGDVSYRLASSLGQSVGTV